MSATNTPASNERADPAWAPLLAASYALLAVAAALFLAAGFTSIDSLIIAVGSFVPAADRIGRFAALTLIGGAVLVAAVPLARRQLDQMSEASAGPRVLAVGITALLLMAPPVQWVLFGRPDPMAAHHHDMEEVDTAGAVSCAGDTCPAATEEHHEGDDHADH